MPIYIYVKKHRTTGLKYLGKTQQDPHKYRGSGTYWKNHISKHGYDVETEIICECQTESEVKERGLYYSSLWNIVESNEWANLKEENGDGFGSEQVKKQWDDPEFRKINSERSKKLWDDPGYRQSMKEKNSGKNNPNYDYTVYHFVHKTGIEEICTRYELSKKYSYITKSNIDKVARGVRKSHKGWRIKKT
jgi:hypothetical protein